MSKSSLKFFIIIMTTIVFSSCKDERSADDLLNDIKENIENNRLEKARKDANHLLKINDKNSDAYLWKGIVDEKLNNKNSALGNFHKSILLDSTNSRAYIERAILKIKLGDYNSAISDCNTALIFRKNDFQSYQTIGLAFELLENATKAIINFELSIKYGCNSGEVFFKLGLLYLSQGDYDKGCMNLSKAGELGFLQAYEIIKSNCNNNDIVNSSTAKAFGQFKRYPNRYVITFPYRWIVDEISNSDKSVLNVSANEAGNFINIIEMNISDFGVTNNNPTILDFKQETFIRDVKQNQNNFSLSKIETRKMGEVDSYYYEFTISKYSESSSKEATYNYIMQVVVHPKTNKLYILMALSDSAEFNDYKQTYTKVFQSFTFI